MAAGLGFKTFTTGEVLTAADTNGYLMQGVLVFASAAARDAAITSPQEGQCCYLKDTDAVLTYSGTAWVGFDDSNAIQNSIVDAKGDIVAASAADTPARLAVGANDLLLTAASGEATGLKYTGGWATWTPTLTNIVKGNGTEVARYCQIGKTVTVYYSLVFGSTSSISSFPQISLPVNASQTDFATGTGTYGDAGVANYLGRVWMNTATTAYGICDRTDGAYSKFESVNASIPFTWGTGDKYVQNFTYEVA